MDYSNTKVPLSKLNKMMRKSEEPSAITLGKTGKTKYTLIRNKKYKAKAKKIKKVKKVKSIPVISYASNKHGSGIIKGNIIKGKIFSLMKDPSIDRIINALKSNKLNKTGKFVSIKKDDVRKLIKKLQEIEGNIKKKEKILIKNVSISLKSFKPILKSLNQDIKDKKDRK